MDKYVSVGLFKCLHQVYGHSWDVCLCLSFLLRELLRSYTGIGSRAKVRQSARSPWGSVAEALNIWASPLEILKWPGGGGTHL